MRSQRAGPFLDLGLRDRQLPGLDGFEAASRLRSRGSTQPVVAATTSTSQGTRERRLAAGCTASLPKPSSHQILRSELSRPIAMPAASGGSR